MNNLARLVKYAFKSIDWPLMVLLVILSVMGLVVMHSAVGGTSWRYADQEKHFLLALFVMWAIAMTPPQIIAKFAVPFYLFVLALLIGVEFFGDTSKGATRWLNLGFVRIQPSEMMKIGAPMMLAWYFQVRDRNIFFIDYVVAAIVLLVPFALIIKQPDLGTALLVFGAGLFVIFFAGLSFKLIIPLAALGVVGLSFILFYEDFLCLPDTDWVVLHDYQKGRICTLLDPTKDPLGKGFHTIQSMIAVGAGGLSGRGYMSGTQAQLDFIPERTTDFIFAVFAEEFGLYGAVILLFFYALTIWRGLMIALSAESLFGRLLAGALTMELFVYVFVNIGMVLGLLPVVGVPLPFFSYGGTALITLSVSFGILMSISKHRKVQH
jgi:rod shape determining protein RodA